MFIPLKVSYDSLLASSEHMWLLPLRCMISSEADCVTKIHQCPVSQAVCNRACSCAYCSIQPSQWALERQVDATIWSISWHITRPDFDIMLKSNCKYHMDINTWCQHDVKNVSKKWALQKQCVNIFCCRKSILAENFVFDVNVRHQFDTNTWCQFDVDSWCLKNFHI